MKEFLLLFRVDQKAAAENLSPDQLQAITKQWQDWLAELTAQNKLAGTGRRLAIGGKVVRPKNIVTNGPYVETKESLAGFVMVKCDTIEEATMAKGCPGLLIGGTVEVRPTYVTTDGIDQ